MRRRRKSYSWDKRRRDLRVPLSLSLIAVLVFGLGWFVWSKAHHHTATTYSSPAPTAVKATPKADIQTVQGHYMFSGTIVLDRTVSRDARTSGGYNYEQPFGGMASLGTYDAAVADLECPITPNAYGPQDQINVDAPKFNCLPEWLPTLKKYFPIINLSSNHDYDRGADGFAETRERLIAAGLQTIGNYNPHSDADNCRILELPVRLKSASGKETSGILPVAFCSFNYKILFSPEPGELEKIQKYQAIMPVFGMLNAGQEYQAQAGATQMSLAHTMIDYGAEFVIGNGTHWIQNTEAYKGRLITYSLGNFIFDQSDYESRRSANISLTMDMSYDDNLAKWLALGQECQSNKDACFDKIQATHLQKPKLKLNFEPIAAIGGLRSVTAKGDATLQAAVEDRLNWTKTLQGLNSH